MDIQNFGFVFQNQSCCDVGQILELSEVGFAVNVQMFIVIWSKMHGGFHRCQDKYSPDQHIGLQVDNWCSSPVRFNLCRKFLNIFSRYQWSEICILWTPTLSFRLKCHHLAQVSWCFPNLQTHHSEPICCHTSFVALHETELGSNSFSKLFEALETFGDVHSALMSFLDTKLIGLGFATAEPF